eukprot:1070641-Pyramimonas_sp.AAC.1
MLRAVMWMLRVVGLMLRAVSSYLPLGFERQLTKLFRLPACQGDALEGQVSPQLAWLRQQGSQADIEGELSGGE